MTAPDFHTALGQRWREPVSSFAFTRTHIWVYYRDDWRSLERTRRQAILAWLIFPYHLIRGIAQFCLEQCGVKFTLKRKTGMVVLSATVAMVDGLATPHREPEREPPDARLAVDMLKSASARLIVAFSRSHVAVLDPRKTSQGYPKIVWQSPPGTEITLDSGGPPSLDVRWPPTGVPTSLSFYLDDQGYRTASSLLGLGNVRK